MIEAMELISGGVENRFEIRLLTEKLGLIAVTKHLVSRSGTWKTLEFRFITEYHRVSYPGKCRPYLLGPSLIIIIAHMTPAPPQSF